MQVIASKGLAIHTERECESALQYICDSDENDQKKTKETLA
jgi:hypothetical protein